MNLDVDGNSSLAMRRRLSRRISRFDFELVLVAGVLVVASAASGEVWAAGLNAMRRGLEDASALRAREARFFCQ